MTLKKKISLSGWGNYPQIETSTRNFRGRRTDVTQNSIARGLGRSYADQAVCANGTTLLTTGYNRILEFNQDTGRLTCQAGCSLETIINIATPKGWFPTVCPGTKFITIGGAIANDVHGKGHHTTGSFANSVIEMQLLLSSGENLTLSRTENSDLFWATVGGLGLTGIITTATIQLTKIETSYYSHKSLSFNNLKECIELFIENDKIYNFSVGWLNTTSKKHSGVITFGNRLRSSEIDTNATQLLAVHKNQKLLLPLYLPTFALNKTSISLLNQVLKHKQEKKHNFIHYDPFFFPLDIIGNWNKGYGKDGFIQYQFVLPTQSSYSGISAIFKLLSSKKLTPFLNVIKQFGEANEALLSFPEKGITVALDFKFSIETIKVLQELNQVVINFGGKVYLAKDAVLDYNSFLAMYPKAFEFLNIKNKFDATGVYNSAIAQRIGLCN
ncbi:MAG: FAD-binding oxidoreductase [Bacteroidetes bacterium]|nr:FAD-binding oxidoreductase [Bacteroidota bacterium]